jgi:GNAT superfamily N-acetyltransferase
MVFWNTYPFSLCWKTLWNRNRFQELVFEKDPSPSPTHQNAILLSQQDVPNLSRIRLFLQQYFGHPPETPILDIPESSLVTEKDLLFYVEDEIGTIAGCIRYHFLGAFLTDNRQPMYVVDCFCIHPSWRKRGVGDYLLTVLHRYANQQGIPYCLFLKEGSLLSIIHTPLFSSRYVYKQVESTMIAHNIQTLSYQRAHQMLHLFHELQPERCIIVNEERGDNQWWKLYQKDGVMILVCFQSAHQWFMEKGQTRRIGWVTCWLESPNATSAHRAEASEQLSDSMAGIFDYIWINEEWTGQSPKWAMDGAFHWYAYQWTTSIHLKGGYCILH